MKKRNKIIAIQGDPINSINIKSNMYHHPAHENAKIPVNIPATPPYTIFFFLSINYSVWLTNYSN